MDVTDPQEGTSATSENPGVTAPQKKQHVPPITIDNVSNQAALLKHLQGVTKLKLEAKLIGTKLRIYPQIPYAYTLIRRYIDENSLEGYTYMLPEDKKLRAVIRGLPIDMPPMEIISDLATQGYQIEECHNMVSRKTGVPMPLFMLSMERSEQHKTIFQKVTSIGYVKVIVEVLRKKYGPPPPNASDAKVFSTLANSAHALPGALSVQETTLQKSAKNISTTSQNAAFAEVNTQRTSLDVPKILNFESRLRRKGRISKNPPTSSRSHPR
ncbi:nucleic-acid-binding protein from transposon X-element [Trichonephila clavata]|uniref:Nucleic-acid-binding protein from transposon X-element n=1 Tax=Trichonephila clavata TaxID=2740835 RepID=A0A8X6KVE3_TRICU|nr:nucleic-acid-binding protein from transposon X-element [Trichonephila clavata]